MPNPPTYTYSLEALEAASPALNSPIGGQSLAAVGLAIEAIEEAQTQLLALDNEIKSTTLSGQQIGPIEIVTEWSLIFDHLRSHCDRAVEASNDISRILTGRGEPDKNL